jgi:mono/diheme cytochrome c family protein
MSRKIFIAVGAIGFGSIFAASSFGFKSSKPRGPVSYNFEVRPILAENCFGCHGPDLKANKADLRLDTFEGATAKFADSEGHAIVPGKPEQSDLLTRINSHDREIMMPEAESGKKLTDAQKDILHRWIVEGARYEKHWAFISPTKKESKDESGWSRNGIDPFIKKALAEVDLNPAGEADKPALLRRVTLTLTGLPPTIEELNAFLADKDPQAYERVVDRLLATDASAEHFTRHWLDAARYADTHGIHIDNYRAIWPYRDWVLAAFKANMRWDLFTTEQIAGDLLPDPTTEQRVATGFNRCLATTGEGGAIPEEYLAIYAKDRVDTTATIWLGLTLGCASCHDHKFDPITTKEFYQFTAFYRNTSMSALDGNNGEHPPVVRIVTPENRARLAAIEPELAGAQNNLATVIRESGDKAKAWAQQKDKGVIPALLTITAANNEALTATTAAKVNLIGKGLPLVPNGIAGASAPVANEAIHALAINELPPFAGKTYSWGAWIYCTGKGRGALFSRMDASKGYRGIDLWVENGKVGAHAIENWPDKATRRLTNNILSVGWHHVMAVWDAKLPVKERLKIYVDGSLAETDSHETGGETIAIEAPVHIGTRTNGPKGLDATVSDAKGILLQDARIYNQALTPNQVLATAVSTLTSTPKTSANIKDRDGVLVRIYAETADPVAQAATKKIGSLTQEKNSLTMGSVVSLVMDDIKGQQAFAHVLTRGEYANKGEKVSPGTPAALHPFPQNAPNNRLGLAQWLMAKENPLVARVTMNRLWYQIMGKGIVETVEDLGITGARPSHPELLDWLAIKFTESGWDHRAMVRLMVTSAAFRQSAVLTAEKLEKDPENRLLSRGPRQRLDAEVIRDQALAAAGLLVRKVGGPSVKPYQPKDIWETVAMKESNTRFYKQDTGEGLWRRSMYTFWKRAAMMPNLEIMNAPTREVCAVRRDRTNTPLQALVTLNDETYVEAARVLADTALTTAKETDARLDSLSKRLLARSLSKEERVIARRTLETALARFRADLKSADALVAVGESKPKATDRAELAAWTIVASQLLNLDEALTL